MLWFLELSAGGVAGGVRGGREKNVYVYESCEPKPQLIRGLQQPATGLGHDGGRVCDGVKVVVWAGQRAGLVGMLFSIGKPSRKNWQLRAGQGHARPARSHARPMPSCCGWLAGLATQRGVGWDDPTSGAFHLAKTLRGATRVASHRPWN